MSGLHTRITEMFEVDHPIFGFAHSEDVVAEVVNHGGIGVSWRTCASAGSHRTSPGMTAGGAAPLTGAPRGIPATPSASGDASGWRRSSAGRRRWAACASCATSGRHGTRSAPRSPPPPTTWCVWPGWKPPRRRRSVPFSRHQPPESTNRSPDQVERHVTGRAQTFVTLDPFAQSASSAAC